MDALKNEMSDFAAEAARAHANAVSEKITSEQEQIQKEVDNVLELVQGIVTIFRNCPLSSFLIIFVVTTILLKIDDFFSRNFKNEKT